LIRPHLVHTPPTSASAGLLTVLVAVLLAAAPAVAAEVPAADAPATVASLAGTYRIDAWRNLETRGLFHFFYLDPGGRFYLAGEWKGSESSRFGGTWSVAGGTVQLAGTADVNTSQGHWTIPYQRTFRVDRSQGALRLTPLPEKNRFGLMGWPNSFVYLEPRPAVNIPGAAIPSDAKRLIGLSEALAPPRR
jgi:hypothetical protein